MICLGSRVGQLASPAAPSAGMPASAGTCIQATPAVRTERHRKQRCVRLHAYQVGPWVQHLLACNGLRTMLQRQPPDGTPCSR